MSATTTVILGGGFGGLSAANTLRRLLAPEHEIVVVDGTPRFYVGAGKTWIMLGERSFEQISESREALLAPDIRFVQARVDKIDLADHSVALQGGALKWDHLVIALGAEMNLAKVPGLAEAAHTFYTVEGAQRLKPVLERFTGGDIAILIPKVPFKCPPAPYEAALLLKRWLEKRGLADKTRIGLYTVEGAPMTTAGPEMGAYIRSELAQAGIGYFTQKNLKRADAATQRVQFEDGSDARYDLLIAIPPHEAPQIVRDAGLTGPSGWIPVEPNTLRVEQPAGVQDVYAAGDITAVPLPGRYKPEIALSLPKAGVFAEAHGRIAAQQIAARILGRAPEESFDGKGYCYLETGAERAVKADGAFFELPHPVMHKRLPDEAQFRDKLAWVERLLRPMR